LIPYREPTRQELTVLRRGFNSWGLFDYVIDKEILLCEKKVKESKIKEVYLTTKDNFKVISEDASLSHIGMLIADLIARVGAKFPFVTVNQTAEALVLYGRDIMHGSILEYGNLSKNNAILIILNENRVPIGLGITTVSLGKNTYTSDKTIVIKTIVDAGHYLRNERQINK
jgi:ribosome biogenesis protein Nip4